jgi:hypothetical protein
MCWMPSGHFTASRTIWLSARGRFVLDLIRIYKALGGGWDVAQTEEQIFPSILEEKQS